ncbi:hypothetical protein [Jannaschia donghaensis]|uniref:Alpha/beta hydrolase family protein n=1 Tax=Jannaschia donghaensis TaxID=420998 RepID=A0A0M6YJH0_9RHOB|nr:hypothetical protein [Jannaschia donghaensis]CTQ49805.1 hypothetical protein JDO7802_01822 [Jannaschia donghaensis]
MLGYLVMSVRIVILLIAIPSALKARALHVALPFFDTASLDDLPEISRAARTTANHPRRQMRELSETRFITFPASHDYTPDPTQGIGFRTSEGVKWWGPGRDSAAALASAGHPFDLVRLEGHSHWFYESGEAIAADAWKWMGRVAE